MRSRGGAARLREWRRSGAETALVDGRRTRIGPPAPRPLCQFPLLLLLLLHHPPGSAAALAPTSGHRLRQAPPRRPRPPDSPPPPSGGGAGLQRRSWRFRCPKPGARSRPRGRRPGYDRGSPAARSGQTESLSQLVPALERSSQPNPSAQLAEAPPARPLLRWRQRSSRSR